MTTKNKFMLLAVSLTFIMFRVTVVPIEIIKGNLFLDRVVLAIDASLATALVLAAIRTITRPTADRLLKENQQLRDQIKNTNEYAMMVLKTLQASLDANERGFYFPEA